MNHYKNFKAHKKLGLICGSFLVLSVAFVMGPSARSYGHASSFANAAKNIQAVRAADMCLSHLQTATSQAPDYTSDNIRGKSRAAAIGILFGAKYALAPESTPSDLKQNARHHKISSKAQAIRNYRNCQKERALIHS